MPPVAKRFAPRHSILGLRCLKMNPALSRRARLTRKYQNVSTRSGWKTPRSSRRLSLGCVSRSNVSLKFAYKNYPTTRGVDDWWAVLPVRIANPAKHSPPCRPFEALIDSGAAICIFHSSIGESIGLNITKGEEDTTTGVSGKPTTIYLHNIALYVPGGNLIKIKAGFTAELPLAGLLGRTGFFEHFKVTFDPSNNLPGFEIERIHRA